MNKPVGSGWRLNFDNLQVGLNHLDKRTIYKKNPFLENIMDLLDK